MTLNAPRLRDKLLQVLIDAYPHELRFTDLFERAGSPSRSVFSESLRSLEKGKLVDRHEISYRFVTYTLNIENYRKILHADKERLAEAERKLGMEKNGNNRPK
jgi:predicted transcriptional regulator